jgi:hypothetical protein
LDHLYPEIVEPFKLRSEYEIDEATFSPRPFFDLGNSPCTITRFDPFTPSSSALQIWGDGACIAQDLNGGVACLVWYQGYNAHPLEITVQNPLNSLPLRLR